MTETIHTSTEFGIELAAYIEETRGTNTSGDEFKAGVTELVEAARDGGVPEAQIRTQIGAKADAMQAALDARRSA